jgi:coenzyme F420-0:L-glutamate ligase/coenzyme F420-1:gamma-L-glutamate ligase
LEIVPLKLNFVVEVGNDVFSIATKAVRDCGVCVQSGDVFVVTSKLVSYEQSRVKRLAEVAPSIAARAQADQYAISPEVMELIRKEADLIYGGVEHALLTLKDNMLTVNAGIDAKNSPVGYVTLWPANLRSWIEEFRRKLEKWFSAKVGVLVTDSSCVPLRLGTVGVALAASGFRPMRDYRGGEDLYGRRIMITQHALAQSLADAAHLVMGEGSEHVPIALVRRAPLEMNDETYFGADMSIPFDECFFAGALINHLNGNGCSLCKCEKK